MPSPVHLLSTVILATAAAFHLPDMIHRTERQALEPQTPQLAPAGITQVSSPTFTMSQNSAEPQRWVF